MVRLLLASLAVVGALAGSTLHFSSKDGTRCTVFKTGPALRSGCDVTLASGASVQSNADGLRDIRAALKGSTAASAQDIAALHAKIDHNITTVINEHTGDISLVNDEIDALKIAMKLEHEALELTDRKLQAADGKLESKDRMLENAIADEKVARQAKDAVLQKQVNMLESLLHAALDRIDTL